MFGMGGYHIDWDARYVNVSGKYLFARQATSLRTMRARDVLSEISGKIGLTYGNLIPEVHFSEAIKIRPYQF